jgi:hypothetical protein
VTIWDSEGALDQSATKADELRERGAGHTGSSITSVEHYEIRLEM